MRVTITGGAGFLGYHLAQTLRRRGDEVRLLDIAEFHPEEYPPGVETAHADVRDMGALLRDFPGSDVVVHAAAALPLWKRRDIVNINVWGTLNVLEAARRSGVGRVLLISSTAVYGVPEKHPLFEEDRLVGVGPYGATKIQAERLARAFRSCNLVVPIIRPKTFIGTGRLGVFQILFDWVKAGKRIPVIGSGRNRYQLLEVEDLCEAIVLAATAPADAANDTFNVGAKRFGTVAEDLGALCAAAGSGARVLPTPAAPVKATLRALEALHLSPLYKWVYGTADKDSFVSTEKIERKLGWQPKYSNAEALIRAYRWYEAHADELQTGTGVTHRVAWDQGALKLVRRWL